MLTDRAPIAAIATPPGNGGVGIVRISGANLSALFIPLFNRILVPRVATFTSFIESDGRCLDQGIALYFSAPNSYTGEDVIELQAHGGQVLMQLLLARVVEAGAVIDLRLAEAGEFTLRAYLNNKMDLAQAEAVVDLIEANSAGAVRSAQASLTGAFSLRVEELVERLIALRTLVEATLDFPEEEIDFLEASDARGQLAKIEQSLHATLLAAKQGVLLRQGARIAIVGPPNVGKSSLLNALAGQEMAIVTPIAGTTRDRIEVQIQIHGVVLTFFDTAGLRESNDVVEQIGIARTHATIKEVDLIIWVADAQAPEIAWPIDVLEEVQPRLLLLNKVDTCTPIQQDRLCLEWPNAILISAQSGSGLDLFKNTLLKALGFDRMRSEANETTFTARTRHIHALQEAQQQVQVAQKYAKTGNQNLELMAEELRQAQYHLQAISGKFSSDDLLGEIFKGFCIGK